MVQARPGTLIYPVDDAESARIQARIAAAIRSWDEDLLAEAGAEPGRRPAARIAELANVGIPENYKADVAPAAAVADLSQVARLKADGSRSDCP